MTSLSRLRALLGRASSRQAPEIDADFADRLEQRLRLLAGGPKPMGGTGERSERRPPWQAAVAVAVAAAAVAAVVVTRDELEPSQVRTIDEITTPTTTPATTTTVTTAPTTTTTAPPTTTTTAAPVAITTTSVPATTTTSTTARPAGTTTTSQAEPSTTTSTSTTAPVRPTTTTTTQPGQVQNLALTCQVTSASSVTCRWAQSTSETFTNYRVIRKANGTETTILEAADRTAQQAVDTSPLAGQAVQYGVLARDRTGKTLGQGGPVSITCC